MQKVKTGLNKLTAATFSPLKGQKIGLLVHPASIDHNYHATRDLITTAGLPLATLFGPQHGIQGQTQDNMVEWSGYRDPQLHIPVYSLYGQHRQPTPVMLDGLDILVVDLQDVGARYYTFIWTLLLCLEACAEAGVKVMVLDRPNPLGGRRAGGNILSPAFTSFVGLAPIPMRHGLTIGELARFFVRHFQLDVDLDVVWMDGWRRHMLFSDTGLPWVLPSPNMPTLDTAVVYPGGCLLEGTDLSEGRGTTRPFEIFGAPFIDPRLLAARLTALDLPGVHFRPLHFEPTFHKFAGQVCGGLQVHVLDRDTFDAVLTYTAAISLINELWPGDFAWKQPPYEYETVKLPIDILAGGTTWREDVEAGRSVADMSAAWRTACADFTDRTRDIRHYE